MITYIFVMRIVMTKHSRIEGFPSTRTWDAPPPRETIGRPSMPKATSDEFVRGANRSRGDRGESLSFAPKNGKSWKINYLKRVQEAWNRIKVGNAWSFWTALYFSPAKWVVENLCVSQTTWFWLRQGFHVDLSAREKTKPIHVEAQANGQEIEYPVMSHLWHLGRHFVLETSPWSNKHHVLLEKNAGWGPKNS